MEVFTPLHFITHSHTHSLSLTAAGVEMDSMFEEPSSPSLVMPAEVAEAEGLVTKPNHSTNNKWGPIVYNRDHHPLHIMVKILVLLCMCMHMRLLPHHLLFGAGEKAKFLDFKCFRFGFR